MSEAMTWRTHALGGVASLWLLRGLPDGISHSSTAEAHNNVGLLALVAAIAALLPDLDARESRIKHLPIAPGVPLMYFPAVVLHRLLGHRGLLHSALGLGIVTVVLAPPLGLKLHSWQAPLALMLGYASHLALDAMTRAGIPLWFPSRRRVHVLPSSLRITTGSRAEEVVLVLLALAALTLLFSILPASYTEAARFPVREEGR